METKFDPILGMIRQQDFLPFNQDEQKSPIVKFTGNDAPAPANIVITPDAVGSNPVTWYYKACYVDEGTKRSLFSEEATFQVGDSTTAVIFSCDAGALEGVGVVFGKVSGIYPDDRMDYVPMDIFPNLNFGSGNYAEINLRSIYQIRTGVATAEKSDITALLAGANGSFVTPDNKLVAVENGIITAIEGPSIGMEFDDIANVPVANASSVSDWNAWFDLPTNGEALTNASVSGNTVYLFGGADITLKSCLFDQNDEAGLHLITFIDYDGCVISLGDSVFGVAGEGNGCPALTTVNLPGIAVISDYSFEGCTALETIEIPITTTIGTNAFTGCTSLETVELPLATTTGINSFKGCTVLETIELPNVTSLGTSCFKNCHALSDILFPEVASIGDTCFANCHGLTSVNLPKLITAGEEGFCECPLLETIELPLATTIGYGSFYSIPSLKEIDLSSCTSFGETTGAEDIFAGATGLTMNLIIPSALMTCNLGNPDGDIAALIAESTNDVTIYYSEAPRDALMMEFDSLANVNAHMGDRTDVDDWNSFFDLPTLGSVFTSVTEVLNRIYLSGGGTSQGIHLIGGKFDYTGLGVHLIGIQDDSGHVVALDAQAFFSSLHSGCPNMEYAIFPAVTNVGSEAFNYCTSLTKLKLPVCTSLGLGAISSNAALKEINLPACTSIPGACITNNSNLETINMPVCETIGDNNFTYSAPSDKLKAVNLPACTALGSTTGDNNVFNNCVGATLTLTIPAALMTCNNGDPDGDIATLQANNTVDIID